MQKVILLFCLASSAAYSTAKKEPKMPEVEDSADYGSPVANAWPIGRDPIPEDPASDAAIQKQREAAQFKIEAILKAKMVAAAAAKKTKTAVLSIVPVDVSSTVVQDEPANFKETRPLGYDLVLRAGDMVKRVQRFLNNYERANPNASEEDWMIAFLDEMKSIDKEDNHILTDRLFTILKERRTPHH